MRRAQGEGDGLETFPRRHPGFRGSERPGSSIPGTSPRRLWVPALPKVGRDDAGKHEATHNLRPLLPAGEGAEDQASQRDALEHGMRGVGIAAKCSGSMSK